jgi:hypothetical protein
MGAVEIDNNTSGRVANKGMEGLAITPDGRTLVGIMQNALIQDAVAAPKLLRLVTIDITSGKTTHEYAYLLTTGMVSARSRHSTSTSSWLMNATAKAAAMAAWLKSNRFSRLTSTAQST